VTERKRGKPTRLSELLPGVLDESGLKARLEQAVVITDWASIVGKDIAKVAQPISISRQGVLTVAVTNAAWMTELAMMELELLRVINEKSGRAKVDRIRWRLVR